MSYTRGPWSIKYLSGIDMLIVSENRKICSFSGFSHSVELMDEHENEEKANANLIATAPDLLNVLEDVDILIGDPENTIEYQALIGRRILEMWPRIQSAIKKARGL